MRLSTGVAAAACLGLSTAIGATVAAPRGPMAPAAATGGDTIIRIVASANALLGTLDTAGRAKLQLPLDSPQKSKWSNLPVGMFPRAGLRLGDLTPPQRAAALALLKAALSPEGYQKVMEIVKGDEVLKNNEGQGGRVRFGEDEYFLALMGTPSVSAPWMIQFGGHHLAINLTLAERAATLAPTLTGAQPATYTLEGRTVRPLGDESDRAFALMASLDAAQRTQAILGAQMADLALGPGQDGRTIQPEGLPASLLSAAQQAQLVEIAREWVGIAHEAFAAPRMAEIRANLPETYFAWSGPTTPGSAAYYRIQGPTLVIEYAPQRGVDHIHTIYRDPTNDYGAAYARR
jgi:hypothetical protein